LYSQRPNALVRCDEIAETAGWAELAMHNTVFDKKSC